MKSFPGVVAVLCLLAACAADHHESASATQAAAADPSDPAPETYALGSALTDSGAVPKDAAADAFQRGREVYLSVDVTGASTDSKIEVRWFDGAGRLVRKEERQVPIGAQYAAFRSGNDVTAIPGPHRATVVINGRRVSEKTFTVL